MTEPDPGAAHRAHFADNRANWDDRAALHEACGYGIAELLASPEALTADVTADLGRLGDLTGLDVIHLQCHLGLDTISLARLGAGLVLEEVGETRVSAWRRWPDLMEPCEGGYRFADPALREMLPLQLVVVARRPGGPRP